MTEFAADEIFLNGRMQVETALDALAYTRINPDAQQRLQTFLDVHAQLSDGESQHDLSIYLKGETAEREKADIVISLEALINSKFGTTETRMAATVLREILY